MNILFLIPTKDGGEGFDKLMNSIKINIVFAKKESFDFSYKIILIINGNPQKPNYFLSLNNDLRIFFKIIEVNFSGKIRSINYVLSKENSDIVVILDDDVFFAEDLLLSALNKLKNDRTLRLVGFKNQVIEYSGLNFIIKFKYNIINIRSLCDLYENMDPFLFGRFLVCKKEYLLVPDDIINEDLYLSIINDKFFVILPKKVFYIGECSILKHIKRVLRIETGRIQLSKIFKDEYKKITNKSVRRIDKEKVLKLKLYYRICYFLYIKLRILTNKIIPFL
jgi:hypothetical protein